MMLTLFVHWFYAIVAFLIVHVGYGRDFPIAHTHHVAHKRVTSPLPLPPNRREIPPKVLIGYASHNYDNVRKAVMQDGVNVVIWAFMDIVSQNGSGDKNVVHVAEDNHQLISSNRFLAEGSTAELQQQTSSLSSSFASVKTGLDFQKIKQLIEELDSDGYSHVLHLASFGGWNGPHLDPTLDAKQWYYSGWKSSIASKIFHGIDWDLEGNDNLASPNNVFSMDCLEKMGEISSLMKRDGYVVSMAPPQSYLNFQSSSFSRFVNISIPEREWHSDFEYFGNNVYAYLLAKYGDFIDLVSIQLYESYSDAAMAIYHDGILAEDYLINLVDNLATQSGKFYVDFSQDGGLNMNVQLVNLPLSKLVIGLANGWSKASTAQNKTVYISGEDCKKAYASLKGSNLGDISPRGFMIWTIEERGKGGIYLARDIGKFLLEE